MPDLPYNYKSSRRRTPGIDPSTVDTFAGRAPSFGRTRQGEPFIRGFRSRPGATQSPRDSLVNLTGMTRDPSTGMTKDSDWGNFFKGNSPAGVRMGYQAANPAIAAAANPATQIPQTPQISDNPTPLPALPSSGAMLASTDTAPTSQGYLGSVISSAQDWMKRFGTDLYG